MNKRIGSLLFADSMVATMVAGSRGKPPGATATTPVASVVVGNVPDIDGTEPMKTVLPTE